MIRNMLSTNKQIAMNSFIGDSHPELGSLCSFSEAMSGLLRFVGSETAGQLLCSFL